MEGMFLNVNFILLVTLILVYFFLGCCQFQSFSLLFLQASSIYFIFVFVCGGGSLAG
jgi:hypothetical protein